LDIETFELLRDTVRRFVDERLIPAEDEVEAADEVPASIIQQMRELGLFGLSIPEAYGGLGLSMFEEAAIIREITRASVVFRSVIGTTVGIGSQGIVMDGTGEQKEKWLPKLATGEAIASFALTEPEAGSDAASVRTKAVLDGDVYRITGVKRYITNAPRASSPSWPAASPTSKAPAASRPSSFRPTPPGSASESPTARWASAAPRPAT
jgi:acyl-CoA dehydrogenase